MSDGQQQKLLFRMQHIIPRNLSSDSRPASVLATASKTEPIDVIGPDEVEFPMTFGKVAGNQKHINVIPVNLMFASPRVLLL